METALRISLPKQKEKKLERIALFYGLSMPDLVVRILDGISDLFPTETLDDYQNPKRVAASLKRALRDYRAGRVHHRL